MAIAPSGLAIQAQALFTPSIRAGSDHAATQQVRSAVKTLNEAQSAGSGREFSISIDAKTKQPVVRIVDSATRELVEQIPTQYALDLAQNIDSEKASTLPNPNR